MIIQMTIRPPFMFIRTNMLQQSVANRTPEAVRVPPRPHRIHNTPYNRPIASPTNQSAPALLRVYLSTSLFRLSTSLITRNADCRNVGLFGSCDAYTGHFKDVDLRLVGFSYTSPSSPWHIIVIIALHGNSRHSTIIRVIHDTDTWQTSSSTLELDPWNISQSITTAHRRGRLNLYQRLCLRAFILVRRLVTRLGLGLVVWLRWVLWLRFVTRLRMVGLVVRLVLVLVLRLIRRLRTIPRLRLMLLNRMTLRKRLASRLIILRIRNRSRDHWDMIILLIMFAFEFPSLVVMLHLRRRPWSSMLLFHRTWRRMYLRLWPWTVDLSLALAPGRRSRSAINLRLRPLPSQYPHLRRSLRLRQLPLLRRILFQNR